MKTKTRCVWANDPPIMTAYHDDEWGIPVHDDRHLFELINLEGAQAGLSWLTVLKKRDNYRLAFDQFQAKKIAGYTAAKKASLLRNAGIIRNRLKIQAVVENAKAFLAAQKEFGSFDRFIWSFVAKKPTTPKEAVAISEQMSKDLKKRGFRFVGPTICYAFMQAGGLINDHAKDCFKR